MDSRLPAGYPVRARKRPQRSAGLAAFVAVSAAALVASGFLLAPADMRQPSVYVALALAFLGGLGLALGVAIFLGRRRETAIAEINETLERVAAGELAARVHVRGRDDEADALAENVNAILEHNQSLVEGLRQVSSDIAHDLRTPVVQLRRRLEAARLQTPSAQGYAEAIDQAIDDTGTIMATFSALLRIARLEAGIGPADLHLIDLSALMEDMAATYAAVAEANGQDLAAAIEPHLFIEADRNLMTQMVVNLIENAIRHTPERTEIMVRLKREGEHAIIEVADTGPGIPAAERGQVTRRFYRLDRSRSTPGSGLGLALVKAVCDYHHATLALFDNGPGLRVVIAMPVGAGRALHAGWGI